MTGWLWTAEEASRVTAGHCQGEWRGVSGVSIDTRELEPGDLFVALAGDVRDGHEFVPQALEAGAVVMVSDASTLPPDASALIVQDTLRALERLGAAARSRTDARVVAVTGSVGKTSTKEMLRTALEGQGRVHAAVRSFNNHWGVPLTLARMPQDTQFAVIEIGMNHAGEITPLSQLARPHVAVITTVEPVHLEAFSSVEGIADAKAEIFAGLEPGGIAVLNRDNPHFDRLAAATSARIVEFGSTAHDVRLKSATVSVYETEVEGCLYGRHLAFRIGAPGEHFASNAMAVLAAAGAAGADALAAAEALGRWSVPSGRGSRSRINLPIGTIELIDESYNANPASLRAALSVLATSEPEGGRRIAILGDMLELGPTARDLHAGLAQEDALARIDRLHTCGPLMRALHDALPGEKRGSWAESSAALAADIADLVDAGDVVMVKGSLGARMAEIVRAIRMLNASANKD